MVAILKLLRPGNCVMGLVGVFIGALVSVGPDALGQEYRFELLLGMFIAFFFMGAGNMFNDYLDRDQDNINHPDRPIPAGIIPARAVLAASIVIFIILLALGILINLIMFLILVLATVLMLGYEIVLKQRGLIGNITISILVGLLFIFGSAVVGEFGIVIFLFLLAFLATLAREIVKDIEDIKGDLDRNTLPKRIGISGASAVATMVLIIAIVLSPIPALDGILEFLKIEASAISNIYLMLVIPADILFIVSILYFTKNPHRASAMLKAGMFISLLAFAFGIFSL